MLERLGLDGKVVIVTGGGTGLGREMVRHLARAGADVVIASRRPGPIEEAAAEVKEMGRHALAIPTDVTDSAQVDRMVRATLDEFGHIDVLFNNAGIVREQQRKPMWEITDEEWRIGIDVNLTGAFYCTRAVIRSMVDRSRGRIINVSSGYGLRGGRDNYMYGAAKAGVIQLTRILAVTYGPLGLTSTCIVPGFLPTESGAAAAAQMAGSGGGRSEFIPIGRFGSPSEIGPLAVFLASDASDYMNGEVFYCDGGGLAGGYAPTGQAPVIPLPEDKRSDSP